MTNKIEYHSEHEDIKNSAKKIRAIAEFLNEIGPDDFYTKDFHKNASCECPWTIMNEAVKIMEIVDTIESEYFKSENGPEPEDQKIHA